MTSSLKWHGGKHYLAARILSLFPPRGTYTHYVEPYFGGGSVLFEHDPEGVSEVINDIDCDLTNFWAVLQHARPFAEFRRRVQAVPFSAFEWTDARAYLDRAPHARPCHPDVNRAVAFFVCCRQSLAGRMETFAPLSRTRTRRGMNEQASAWLAVIDGLPEVHARLQRVVILTGDALAAIRSQDGPDTLFYLDPPYMPDARAAPDVYRCEMDRPAHLRLLELLSRVKGKFVLSGYANPDYDAHSEKFGWQRREFDLPNNSAGGKAKRRMKEVVWANYQLPTAERVA
jgi:DNA adenine methylase